MSLEGSTAIITGSGSGIGRGTAIRAGQEGMQVIVADIKNAEGTAAEITQAGGKATAVELDVRDPAAWKGVIDQTLSDFGRIDLLSNIAGIVVESDTAVDLSDEGWAHLLSINLTGYFYGMRAALPSMIETGGGAVVNIASVAGLVGMQDVFAYSAAKGGVIGMSRQAAMQYAGSGVRINSVCPGVIETPILGDITPELKQYAEDATPVGRLGQPADIASMVIHLARPESAFITGQAFVVDGGWTAQ